MCIDTLLVTTTHNVNYIQSAINNVVAAERVVTSSSKPEQQTFSGILLKININHDADNEIAFFCLSV